MSHPLNLTLDLYLKRMESRGEFKGLEGEGAPIDLSKHAPSVIDKLMTEADVKPVYVLLSQKEQALRQQLRQVQDVRERRKMQRDLADLRTRMAIEVETWNRFG